MLMVEFSIHPLDKGTSVGESVARALDVIDRSGIAYQLGPMGTCLEGEWDEVMAVMKACYEAVRRDSERVVFSVKADWRKGDVSRLASKVDGVQARLGRKIRTAE